MQLIPIEKIFSNRDSIRTARDAFLIPIVPEEGWFVQPKYNSSSKNHPTLCRFLLLYSLVTGSLFQFTSLTGFLLRYTCSLQAPFLHVRGCLHDTGATFAPERIHSGSLSWLYTCLHDTTTKCYAGASHPGVSSPRFSHRGENFTPVRNLATLSCKRETTTHFGVKSVCR